MFLYLPENYYPHKNEYERNIIESHRKYNVFP